MLAINDDAFFLVCLGVWYHILTFKHGVWMWD